MSAIHRKLWHGAMFLAIVLGSLAFGRPVPVSAAEQCFPQTNYCISGRFLEYWHENGGLSIFGYPLGPAHQERNLDTGQVYLTQWFERNRFELHPENAAPYDVLLGRLGADRLAQQGRNWQAEERESGPRSGCLWFAQTGHNVCNQAAGDSAQAGFMSYWQLEGLRDAQLDQYGRSLALHGLPLTTARMETNSSGDTVLTQWFERGRMEWHPNNPAGFRVLLGLLGSELRALSVDDPAHPRLQRGDSGPAVAELQQRLNIWIATTQWAGSPLPVTGYFGAQTETAVRGFQVAHALPVTGEVDGATWAKLPPLPAPRALKYFWPDSDAPLPFSVWPEPHGGSFANEAGFKLNLYRPHSQRPDVTIAGGSVVEADGRPSRAVTERGQFGSAYSTGAGYTLVWIEDGRRYMIASDMDLRDVLDLAEGLEALDLQTFRKRLRPEE